MKWLYIAAAAVFLAASCSLSHSPGDFTDKEIAIIDGSDSIMRVLTVRDSADFAVLRSVSCDFSAKALRSSDFKRLAELMVATVTHPSQDGVGIAGPQVGLNRRVVAVQRFDKEGGPFEVYANIRILCLSDSLAYGPEGCLSVPDMRGDVLRSQEIVVEYADMKALTENNGSIDSELPMTRDTVRGFTAVIFQHEIDHLEGVLYIDRL